MCWKAIEKRDRIQLTAETDMPVYKVIGRNGRTPYMEYEIPVYGEPLPKKELRLDPFDIVVDSYHSYSTEVAIYDTFESLDIEGVARYYHNNVVHKCYIPKGTKYYMNSDKEMVSETIVVTKELYDGCAYSTIPLDVAILEDGKICFRKLSYDLIENYNVVGIRITEDLYLSLSEEDWNTGKGEAWKDYDEKCEYSDIFLFYADRYYNLMEKLGHKIDWNIPWRYNMGHITFSSPLVNNDIIDLPKGSSCYKFRLFYVPASEIEQ